jgi:radical SAM protein with 4Fe4S-binding SPASM domain
MERRVKDKQTYLDNLQALFALLTEKKIHINRWEIFGGDLFHDEIIFDLFEAFYNYYEPLVEELSQFEAEFSGMITEVIIPNNLSYFQNEKIFKRVAEWRKKLTGIKVILGFSYSTDGKYAVDSREQKELSDEYWDVQFARAAEIEAGFHPMISPENVDRWIENYDWWLHMYEKHNLNHPAENFQPPMLEVRNDGWTDEKIESYMRFLHHLFMRRLEMCDNDIEKMAYHYFKGQEGPNRQRTDILPHSGTMDPLLLYPDKNRLKLERATCSIQELLHIDLADMSIVPCHRLAYEVFRAGKFIIEDGKIVDFDPHNVTAYLAIHTMNVNLTPECPNCVHNEACAKGCMGAQYEYIGEPFLNIPSVCNLLKAKHNFIIKMLNESGVLQKALDYNYLTRDQKDYYVNISRRMGYNING